MDEEGDRMPRALYVRDGRIAHIRLNRLEALNAIALAQFARAAGSNPGG